MLAAIFNHASARKKAAPEGGFQLRAGSRLILS
jgi:hypothetical protein